MDDNKIDQLVTMELRGSYIKHGRFNSTHEGYAVLKEEIEEATDELAAMEALLNATWQVVKQDKLPETRELALHMQRVARRALEEIIQVEAMCAKLAEFIDSKEEAV